MKLHDTHSVERAVLAQVVHAKSDAAEAADSLLELQRLADTAGLEVVGQLTQNRLKPDGGTMFGSGKVEDLKSLVEAKEANTVIFDNELNAFQAFNLAKALDARVMDRTEVILEIFARRARSAEAQLQVELAKTQFLLSRIPVTESQQRFAGGGGGAYVRGPGEGHLHLRNAPLRRRVAELKKRLEAINKRQIVRDRVKRKWPVVSLVGYTNAGKSTLLNALSGADAYIADRHRRFHPQPAARTGRVIPLHTQCGDAGRPAADRGGCRLPARGRPYRGLHRHPRGDRRRRCAFAAGS
jgi:GTP-binding protein HflX